MSYPKRLLASGGATCRQPIFIVWIIRKHEANHTIIGTKGRKLQSGAPTIRLPATERSLTCPPQRSCAQREKRGCRSLAAIREMATTFAGAVNVASTVLYFSAVVCFDALNMKLGLQTLDFPLSTSRALVFFIRSDYHASWVVILPLRKCENCL